MTIRLSEFFEEDLFIPALASTDKTGVLRELVEALTRSQRIREGEILFQMLEQREKLGSTGIGRGVAIPHGRSLAMTRLAVVFGRSEPGVEFDALYRRLHYTGSGNLVDAFVTSNTTAGNIIFRNLKLVITKGMG